MNNFEFILTTGADLKGFNSDMKKAYQEMKNNPVVIEAGIDFTKAKIQAEKDMKSIASSIKSALGDNGIDVSEKSILSYLGKMNTELDKEKSKIQQINSLMSSGGINKSVVNATSQYERLSNVTSDLETDFKQLRVYQEALSNSGTGNELVSNYEKFSDTLSKVNNQIKVLQTQQRSNSSGVKAGYEKEIFGNSIISYLNNNTKLSNNFKNKLMGIYDQLKTVDNVDLGALKKQFRSVTSEAEALGQTGDNITTRLKKNAGQLLNFLGSTTLIMGSANAIRSMVQNVEDLDKATTDLKKVTNNTSTEYQTFLNNSATSAKQLGVSMTDIIGQTADWARAGYDLQDSFDLSKVSSIFQNVGDVDAQTAVSDILTPMKAFNLTAKDSIEIVNKLNQVDNEFAVSSAGIGDGLKNSASALALAGNDINQSIAMITGGSEITQNASEQGNAIKVLSMRLRGKFVPPYAEMCMLCA